VLGEGGVESNLNIHVSPPAPEFRPFDAALDRRSHSFGAVAPELRVKYHL
jgi:hypothetical protein